MLEEVAAQLLEKPPRLRARVATVSPALDRLVGRLLAKDPGERPANAGLVALELQEVCVRVAEPGLRERAPDLTADRSLEEAKRLRALSEVVANAGRGG